MDSDRKSFCLVKASYIVKLPHDTKCGHVLAKVRRVMVRYEYNDLV